MLSLEDLTVTYDGSVHSLVVNGQIPNTLTVSYKNNNQSNAGVYEVEAILTPISNNYEVSSNLKATLTINPKVVAVTLPDTTVNYDGNAHSIYVDINNDDIIVNYENNGQVEVGTYTVTAQITSKSGNYSYPNYLEATLTINPQLYDITYN